MESTKINTKFMTNTRDIVDSYRQYNLFSWNPQGDVHPMVLKKAEGCYMWDNDDNKYFDMASQLVCVSIGHSNPKIIQAIKDQADSLIYAKPYDTTIIREAFVRKLMGEFVPKCLKKVFFSQCGSDANEVAVRFALEVTGRQKIFSQYNSYHGSTWASANLCGDGHRSAADPTIPGFVHFNGFNCTDTLKVKFASEEEYTEYLLDNLKEQMDYEGFDRIAAIFFETITGGSGAIVPPKGYYQGVRKICDEHGILLVFDEVMVGFGRTGKKFAFEHFGIEPDMVTFAKGVTSAYLPLGGCMVNQKIADFFQENAVPTGGTYCAHPMSCAAALACLEVYEEENLIENSRKMGEILKAGLEKLVPKHPSIRLSRGIGLLHIIQLVDPIRNDEYSQKLCAVFKEKGYLTFGRMGGACIAPPLIVTEEEIKGILKVTDEVMSVTDTWI